MPLLLFLLSPVLPNIAGNMEEWEYTFDPVSKAEWIRQIETDLRQKTVDTLTSEWWPEEPLIPIFHREDLVAEVVQLPSHLFALPPVIIEEIQIESKRPQIINQKILEALRFGAQVIRLRGVSGKDNFNSVWMNDVFADIITVQLECDSETIEDTNLVFENTPDYIQLRVSRTNSNVSIRSVLAPLKDNKAVNIDRLKFVYPFNSNGNWTDHTSTILNCMLHDLDEWQDLGYSSDSFFSMTVFNLQSDIDYFKQIIQTRTHQILWRNIFASHSLEEISVPDRFLETTIIQGESETPNDFLIRASMSSLAASLSGVHAISVRSNLSENNPDFYTRINRSIHHLLHLESGMNKSVDPLAGAYAIDFYTKQWVSRIWANLAL